MIWMYWEGPKPLWIDRCQQTVFWHCDDVRLLGPQDDELQPLFREVDLSKLCMAHKADLIRAYLLEKHGGFWVDSDCVVFRPLKPIFDLAADHGFVVSPQHDGNMSGSFQGCTAGHAIAAAWHRRQREVLASGSYDWLSFTAHALRQAILKAKTKWYRLNHWVVQPIPWSDPERFYALREDCEHAGHLHKDSYTYMMANNMNRGVNPGHDLLEEKTFFSYLLRQSHRNIGARPIRVSGTPMEAGKC